MAARAVFPGAASGDFRDRASVAYFWDIENVSIPKNANVRLIVDRLRRQFADSTSYNEKHFVVVCDVRSIPREITNRFNNSNVEVSHVDASKKNAADTSISAKIHQFADELDRSPQTRLRPRVVLLSGDIHFKNDLHRLKHKKQCETVLIHGGGILHELTDFADQVYDLRQFFGGKLPLLSSTAHEAETTVQPNGQVNYRYKFVLHVQGYGTTKLSDFERYIVPFGGKVITYVPNGYSVVGFRDEGEAASALYRIPTQHLGGCRLTARWPPNSEQGRKAPTIPASASAPNLTQNAQKPTKAAKKKQAQNVVAAAPVQSPTRSLVPAAVNAGSKNQQAPKKPVPKKPEGTQSPKKPVPKKPEGTQSPKKPVPKKPEGTQSLKTPVPKKPEGTQSPKKPVPKKPEGMQSPKTPVPKKPKGTQSPAQASAGAITRSLSAVALNGPANDRKAVKKPKAGQALAISVSSNRNALDTLFMLKTGPLKGMDFTLETISGKPTLISHHLSSEEVSLVFEVTDLPDVRPLNVSVDLISDRGPVGGTSSINCICLKIMTDNLGKKGFDVCILTSSNGVQAIEKRLKTRNIPAFCSTTCIAEPSLNLFKVFVTTRDVFFRRHLLEEKFDLWGRHPSRIVIELDVQDETEVDWHLASLLAKAKHMEDQGCEVVLAAPHVVSNDFYGRLSSFFNISSCVKMECANPGNMGVEFDGNPLNYVPGDEGFLTEFAVRLLSCKRSPNSRVRAVGILPIMGDCILVSDFIRNAQHAEVAVLGDGSVLDDSAEIFLTTDGREALVLLENVTDVILVPLSARKRFLGSSCIYDVVPMDDGIRKAVRHAAECSSAVPPTFCELNVTAHGSVAQDGQRVVHKCVVECARIGLFTLQEFSALSGMVLSAGLNATLAKNPEKSSLRRKYRLPLSAVVAQFAVDSSLPGNASDRLLEFLCLLEAAQRLGLGSSNPTAGIPFFKVELNDPACLAEAKSCGVNQSMILAARRIYEEVLAALATPKGSSLKSGQDQEPYTLWKSAGGTDVCSVRGEDWELVDGTDSLHSPRRPNTPGVLGVDLWTAVTVVVSPDGTPALISSGIRVAAGKLLVALEKPEVLPSVRKPALSALQFVSTAPSPTAHGLLYIMNQQDPSGSGLIHDFTKHSVVIRNRGKALTFEEVRNLLRNYKDIAVIKEVSPKNAPSGENEGSQQSFEVVFFTPDSAAHVCQAGLPGDVTVESSAVKSRGKQQGVFRICPNEPRTRLSGYGVLQRSSSSVPLPTGTQELTHGVASIRVGFEGNIAYLSTSAVQAYPDLLALRNAFNRQFLHFGVLDKMTLLESPFLAPDVKDQLDKRGIRMEVQGSGFGALMLDFSQAPDATRIVVHSRSLATCAPSANFMAYDASEVFFGKDALVAGIQKNLNIEPFCASPIEGYWKYVCVPDSAEGKKLRSFARKVAVVEFAPEKVAFGELRDATEWLCRFGSSGEDGKFLQIGWRRVWTCQGMESVACVNNQLTECSRVSIQTPGGWQFLPVIMKRLASVYGFTFAQFCLKSCIIGLDLSSQQYTRTTAYVYGLNDVLAEAIVQVERQLEELALVPMNSGADSSTGCCFCSETALPGDAHCLESCGHRFCRSCLALIVVWQLRNPGYFCWKCRVPMVGGDLRVAMDSLKNDKPAVARVESHLAEWVGVGRSAPCPTFGCTRLIPVDDPKRHTACAVSRIMVRGEKEDCTRCMECRNWICRKCLDFEHPKKRCTSKPELFKVVYEKDF